MSDSTERSARDVFREALDLLTGDGPDEDAGKARELFMSLSPDQLERISGAMQMLLVAIEMTRMQKIKQLAGRN